MSNIFYDKATKKHHCKYFQVPQRLIDDGLLAKMRASELKLYAFLVCKAQQHSTVILDRFPNCEVQQYTGLSASSIRSGRTALEALRLVRTERLGSGAFRYILLHPLTGEPLPNPRTGSVTTMLSSIPPSTSGFPSSPEEQVSAVSQLSRTDFEHYYKSRLVGQHGRRGGDGLLFCCPFHNDTNASLKVTFSTGVWFCFGCGEGGGAVAFEQKLSGCTKQEALAKVGEAIGKPLVRKRKGPEPLAVYDYVDEYGELLYQKLRFENKRFKFQAWVDGGWVPSLDGIRRVLYRLPEVISARTILCAEGEKDADRLSLDILKRDIGTTFAATTNDDGANSWRDEFAQYFWGKNVWILPDNDDPGRDHALRVAHSIASHAAEVRIVHLPGLNLKEDVSDFLDRYSFEDLLEAAEYSRAFELAV